MGRLRNRIPEGVQAGPGTYFAGPPVILWPRYGSKLIVGNYTSIAAEVTFFLGGHHYTDRVAIGVNRKKASYSKGDIRIGSDCWIGHGAVILDGVTIGDGAVVGAFAVVAKSVAPYTIVVGNPAQKIKNRFGTDTVARLLKIKWWEWPSEKIAEALPLLQGNMVDEFIRVYG